MALAAAPPGGVVSRKVSRRRASAQIRVNDIAACVVRLIGYCAKCVVRQKNIFLNTMTCFPLLAPFQAVRKPTQRRTSLYSGPTWTDQVISRGGPRSALGDRLTGEADDRRAGRMGGEGRDNGPPDSERAGLPGGPHHPTSKSQARSTRSREHSSTPRRHAKI